MKKNLLINMDGVLVELGEGFLFVAIRLVFGNKVVL